MILYVENSKGSTRKKATRANRQIWQSFSIQNQHIKKLGPCLTPYAKLTKNGLETYTPKITLLRENRENHYDLMSLNWTLKIG